VKTPRYPPALLAMLIALPVPSSPAASRDPSWVDTVVNREGISASGRFDRRRRSPRDRRPGTLALKRNAGAFCEHRARAGSLFWSRIGSRRFPL